MALLMVGLNISGMMLVRSAMREKELAIRLAMGASRWRLMRGCSPVARLTRTTVKRRTSRGVVRASGTTALPKPRSARQRVIFALPGAERHNYTVVGVTADLVSTQMGNPRPQLFVSLAQHPASTGARHRTCRPGRVTRTRSAGRAH
jgi:hypothetical protein